MLRPAMTERETHAGEGEEPRHGRLGSDKALALPARQLGRLPAAVHLDGFMRIGLSGRCYPAGSDCRNHRARPCPMVTMRATPLGPAT